MYRNSNTSVGGAGGGSPPRSRAPGVHLLQQFNEHCALWRFRCPVAEVEQLGQSTNSLYSPEFMLNGRSWRIHLQMRADGQGDNSIAFLAIHLQCVLPTPQGTYAHFKLTLCNANRENSKAKAFHCSFKKGGSAWGLHHFIERERLLNPESGFIDFGVEDMPGEFDSYHQFGGQQGGGGRRGRGTAESAPCIVIDCLLRIVLPNAEGNYDLGLPTVSKSLELGAVSAGGTNGAGTGGGGAWNGGGHSPSRSGSHQPHSNGGYPTPAAFATPSGLPTYDPVDVAILPPGEGNTTDMKFRLSDGSLVAVHRCVVAARLTSLVPEGGLQPDATLDISTSHTVFDPFLRFVYTEEPPERGSLKPVEFIELYLLAMKFGFFTLAECCLAHVEATIRYSAILPIACAKYDPNDEILTNFYIRIMASGYKEIIEDPQYERLPGPLHRKLSLVVYSSSTLPAIIFPKMVHSLSAQLSQLAESGEYADYEIPLQDGTKLRAHKCILASRSPLYAQVFNKGADTSVLPKFDSDEFGFSRRAWESFLAALYGGGLVTRDLSAEDIAMIFKLSDTLQLRGSLRESAKGFISEVNALRVLIYAEKHNVVKLKNEPSMQLVAQTFGDRIHRDQPAWELVADLSKPALLGLFRNVVSGGGRR
jgi:hypothetical protein